MNTFWNIVKCFFFGHRKLKLQTLGDNDVLELRDCVGSKLIRVNVCSRCGRLYTNLEHGDMH